MNAFVPRQLCWHCTKAYFCLWGEPGRLVRFCKRQWGGIPTQHTSDCLAQYDIPPFDHANWHPNRIQSGGLLEETRLAVVNESRFLFLFLCENEKKTVRKKKTFANVVKKHVGQIFSPARKIPTLYSDSQTVVSF
jgi:hypothetical protein